MLNILLISHELTVTGAPNSLLRQAKYFKAAGYNVEIWSLENGNLLQAYKDAGFNPIIIKNSRREIKKTFESQNKKFDLILCNTTVCYKAVDVLQRYNIPLIWFIRETKILDENMELFPDFAKVFSGFYNIYTVSEYAAKVSKKYNKNVRIINNAVMDCFSKFHINKNKVSFGFIGSLVKAKGFDQLIDTYIKLSKKYNNIELLIAGNILYQEAQNYLDFTKDFSSIKWLGEIQGDEKQRFFNNIDCLVVPSQDEPSGLVLLEGAMYGKALIATDKVGANYIIENGKNGFIVPVNNSNKMYDAMEKMILADLNGMQKYSRKQYLKFATIERENKDVLKMLMDNLTNYPPVINFDLIMEDKYIGLKKFLIRMICLFVPFRSIRQRLRNKYKNQ